jgi:hypothetical protein
MIDECMMVPGSILTLSAMTAGPMMITSEPALIFSPKSTFPTIRGFPGMLLRYATRIPQPGAAIPRKLRSAKAQQSIFGSQIQDVPTHANSAQRQTFRPALFGKGRKRVRQSIAGHDTTEHVVANKKVVRPIPTRESKLGPI